MKKINNEIVTRYSKNPILTKQDVPYQVQTVHNAGVIKKNNSYLMLFRSHLRNGRSIIGIAESADDWILQPEDQWEICGYVHNVVFACGAVPEDDGTVKLYWGSADTVICAGIAKIDDLVDICKTKSRPAY